jgi:hypothetical protein
MSGTLLAVGAHTLTAIYSGDNDFAGSSARAVTQTVNRAATMLVLVSSVNPSVFGQSVTFTASVHALAPGAGAPTGTVTLQDGTTILGSSPIDSSGLATFSSLSTLAAGMHALTAVYNGDDRFLPSTTAALTQTVTGVPSPSSPATSSPTTPSSTPGSQSSSTTGTPASKSSGTTNVDAGLLGAAGNGLPLGLAGAVSGQVSTSSGTILSAESIRTPDGHPGASGGPGSGSEDLAGLRNEVRPSELLGSRFELGLPASNEIISGLDLAGSLLTGRSTVNLLPQKSSSIAPVAVVVTGGAGDDRTRATAALTEEKSLWPNLEIGLDDTIDRGPVITPEKAADNHGAACTPNGRRGIVDQVFERWLPVALHEMVNQPVPAQAGTLGTMLGAALLLAGIWQTRRRARLADGRGNGCVPRTTVGQAPHRP